SYADQRKDDLAIADYDKAIGLDAKYLDAYVNRGRAFARRKDYDRALADFDAATGINPDNVRARYNRAEAYEAKNDFSRAVEDYDALTRLQPSNAGIWNGRCWARAVIGADLDGALADCNESLRLKPDVANTIDSRALVNLKRGDLDAALADYDRALSIDPRLP